MLVPNDYLVPHSDQSADHGAEPGSSAASLGKIGHCHESNGKRTGSHGSLNEVPAGSSNGLIEGELGENGGCSGARRITVHP
jgi:hypothetical protein